MVLNSSSYLLNSVGMKRRGLDIGKGLADVDKGRVCMLVCETHRCLSKLRGASARSGEPEASVNFRVGERLLLSCGGVEHSIPSTMLSVGLGGWCLG